MRRDEVGGARVSHALAILYVASFLALVIGKDATWYPAALELLGVGALGDVLARPWTLLTHLVVHREPFEGLMAIALLLLVGPPLEDRVGARRTLVVYGGTAVVVALVHATMASLGVAWGPLLTGSLGASAGLLTAYLFVFGPDRQVGNAPFPLVYVATAGMILAVAGGHTIWGDVDTRRGLEAAELVAYKGETLAPQERVDRLWAAHRARDLRPDAFAHVVGLSAGGASLFALALLARWRAQRRMRQEIDGLAEEVEARARVEGLLEKITRAGLPSLSRGEKAFLKYASRRFYRSERVPAAGASGGGEQPSAGMQSVREPQ